VSSILRAQILKSPGFWWKKSVQIGGFHHFIPSILIDIAVYKFIAMIKLQVIGHLGKDCTTNVVSGKNVINFSVAHSEKFKDSMGNQKERTTWVECAYWTERTAIAPYLKKGQLVFAEGSPEVRTYTKSDGTTAASLTVRIQSVQLLGSANRSEGQAGNYADQQSAQGNEIPVSAQVAETADDLPF
jgi:single-strand DNA-binding protein